MKTRIRYFNSEKIISSDEIWRSPAKRDKNYKALKYEIDLSKIYEPAPTLNLPPKAVMSFAVNDNVPSDAVCRIEVTVLAQLIINSISGRARVLAENRWVGEWKSSIVSLPLPSLKEEKKASYQTG